MVSIALSRGIDGLAASPTQRRRQSPCDTVAAVGSALVGRATVATPTPTPNPMSGRAALREHLRGDPKGGV
jgi:hypothetical protein